MSPNDVVGGGMFFSFYLFVYYTNLHILDLFTTTKTTRWKKNGWMRQQGPYNVARRMDPGVSHFFFIFFFYLLTSMFNRFTLVQTTQ
jgi:hypothetical protein